MNLSRRLLGTGEVARFLGVSRAHVYRLAKSGKLRSTRVSKGDLMGYVFGEADVRRFQTERIRKAEHDPRIHLRRSAEKE